MIIYLTGANFSSSNIGKIDTCVVSINTSGTISASWEDPDGSSQSSTANTFTVKKNSTHLTIAISRLTDLTSDDCSTTVGTGVFSSGTYTVTVSKVESSNIKIKAIAGSTGGGSDDDGDEPTPDGTYSWNITFTKSKTIGDTTGIVSSGTRGVSEIITTDNSMKVVVTSCKYIIYAYSDTSASKPLGFVANDMSTIGTAVVSALRWHEAGTTRTLIELLALNANIKAIRLMTYDNIDNPTYSVTSSLTDPEPEPEPGSGADGWEIGTISGATGQLSENASRVRTPDYIVLDGKTSVTVSNVDFIIACYASDNTYLGKYLNGVVNTTVEWITAGTVVNVSDILAANSSVAKIKLVGYSTNANSPTIV